jgi:hypothetical protein
MTACTRARAGLLPLLVSMSLLLAAPLRAQEVATSFEELRRLVKPGDTIYVTDTGGATIKGKLAGLSAASLEIRVQRDALAPPLRLPEGDVNHIVLERSDSLWNGTLIGLAVGAVPAALIELFAGRSEYGPGVPRDAPRYKAPFDAGPIVGLGGIGLVTGLLIDVFNKERATIYVHAPGQRSSGVRVSPLLSQAWSGAGVQVSVGF